MPVSRVPSFCCFWKWQSSDYSCCLAIVTFMSMVSSSTTSSSSVSSYHDQKNVNSLLSSQQQRQIARLPFRYNPNCVQWWNFNLARYTQQARVRFTGFSSNECKIKRDISTSCRIVLGNLNITQVLSLSKIAERSFRFTQLNMKIIRSTSRRKL